MLSFVKTYRRVVEDAATREMKDLGRWVGTTFREAFTGSMEDITGAMTDAVERLGSMIDSTWDRTVAATERFTERMADLAEKMVEQKAKIKEAQATDRAAAKTNAAAIKREEAQLALMRKRLDLAKQNARTVAATPVRDNTDAIRREQTSRQNILDSIAKERKEVNDLRRIRGKTAAEQVSLNRQIERHNDSIASKLRRVAASDERIARLRATNERARATSEAQRKARVDAASLAVAQQKLAIERQIEKVQGLKGKGKNSATAKEMARLAKMQADMKKLTKERAAVEEEGRKKAGALEWAKQYVTGLQQVTKALSEQRDAIRAKLEAAMADLEEWQGKIKSYVEGVQSSIRGAMDITSAFGAEDTGKALGKSLLEGLGAALTGAASGSGVADLARLFEARLRNAMNGVSGESVDAVRDALKSQLEALGPQVGQAEADLITRLRMMVSGAVENTMVPGMGQVIERARAQLDKVKDFAGTIKRLISLGLNKTSLDQIIQAGPFSELAGVWKEANATQVAELNAIMGSMDEYAKLIGTDGAEALFGAGRDAAQALVEGLKSQEKAITSQLERIAQLIEDVMGQAAGVNIPKTVGRVDYTNPGAGAASGVGAKVNPDGSHAARIATPIINVMIGEESINGYITDVTYGAVTSATSAARARNGY